MAVNTIDIRDLIIEKLKELERNIAWLSRQTDINYNTLYSVLVQKTIDLSEANRIKINAALGTDY